MARCYLNEEELKKKCKGEGTEKPTKPLRNVPNAWKEAGKKFVWHDRARAFDNYCYAEREADFKRWDHDLREMRRKAAIDNFAIADRMAKYPLDTQSFSEDGKTIIINPARWSMRDIATLRLSGSDLGDKAVRRPDVDLLQAVEVMVAEGILPANVLGEGEQGYDEMRDRLRRAIAGNGGDIISVPSSGADKDTDKDIDEEIDELEDEVGDRG